VPHPKILAHRIAEAQIDLHRVRYARRRLLSELLSNPDNDSERTQRFATILSDKARQWVAFDRYERRALSRRKFAVRAFDGARRRINS
jgi:hypothetical protein